MRDPLRFLLTLIVLGCVSPMARASDIYVLTNSASGASAASTNFGKIDSVTGSYTSIANLTGNVWNLAWNPTANNFFATAGGPSTLRTLTTTGTLSASLGSIGRTIYTMAYRTTDSKLYGYDFSTDSTGTISSVNGAWTMLNASSGVIAGGSMGGRYSIMNDTMYFAGGSASIGTVGYTATSSFQLIATDSLYVNMVLANDGTTMYGIYGDGTAGHQRLYTIDVGTGATTAGPLITGTGLGTYFHGAGIVPVPEPSTYALGVIATGVMAAVARRRKARKA